MRRQFATIIFLSIFGSAPAVFPETADAGNRNLENALATYSDVSVFYLSLLNTGVLNQLDENTHYTIFAPVNSSFSELPPNLYPCFYSIQCRPQVADVLRNHIVVGRQSLKDLVREAEVPTIGHTMVVAESPYVHEFTVGGHRILSGEELNGNMIYRVDGVIMTNRQLAQFRDYPPAATIVTYHAPPSYPVPGAGFEPTDITQQTVTDKTFVTPEGYPAGEEKTIVTRMPAPPPY